MKLVSSHRLASAVATLALGSTFIVVAEARYMILVDPDSVYEKGGTSNPDTREIPTRVASAKVNLDNEDITGMSSITLAGLQGPSGTGEFVYTQMTSSKRSRENTTDVEDTIWQGALDGDRIGFATFLRSPEGGFFGSFTTEDTAYTISTTPDGNTRVEATLFKDFPPSIDFDDDSDQELREDDFDYSGLIPLVPESNSGRKLRGKLEDGAAVDTTSPASLTDIREVGKTLANRDLQASTVIRVLVVVTNRAMCEAAGLNKGCSGTSSTRAVIENRLRIAEADTTRAFQGMGLSVALQITSFVHLTASYDGLADGSTLSFISADSNVNSWRRDARADLVALITGGTGSVCGIAQVLGAYSVTAGNCLSTYTFTHELGHNLGCLHDRSNSGSSLHAYAHGWRDPNRRFRTVMAYDCSPSCPVVPYFSSDTYTLSGARMGDSSNNNIRRVSETAGVVAGWMS
jgi:Metallo-peptidase family M12